MVLLQPLALRAQSDPALPAISRQIDPFERATLAHIETDLFAHIVISLEDKQGGWSPAKAAAELAGPNIIRPTSAIQELGRYRHPGWAGFALRNSGDKSLQQVVFLNQPTIDHTELFQWNGRDWEPVPGRHETATGVFERDRYPSFDITLAPGTTQWYLLRQHTVSPMRFTLMVHDPRGHHADELGKHAILAPVFIVPIAVGLLLLSVRRLTNADGQGLFLGFIAADIFGAAWLVGLIPELLPQASPELLRTLAHTAYGLLVLFASIHLLRFLDVYHLAPRTSRVVVTLSALFAVLVVVVSVLDPWSAATLLLSGSAIAVISNISLSIFAWRQGHPYGATYTLAWAVYFFSFVMFALYKAGWIIPHAWGITVYMQSAGVCVLLGYAIARSLVERDGRLSAALLQSQTQREEIERLSLDRDRLFAAANHDLRQPLQAIALNVELLKARAAEIPEVNAIISRMRLALGSMSGMLSALLDLRRADHSGMSPQLDAVELQPLLQRLAIQYREQARAKGLALRLVPTRVWVKADAVWLERIVSNLLANALRYTATGRILVGVRRSPDSRVRIVVIDTGRGIAAKDLPGLFGEHEQGSKEPVTASNRNQGRYGLGLYIVKRLALTMGATVSADSVEGKGSRFTIHVPRVAPPQPAASSSEVTKLAAVDGLQVLLVDDDPLVLGSLTDSLTEAGAVVTATENPDAVRALLTDPARAFDVILSDLYFRGYPHGLELLQLARLLQPKTARLMMTADPEALRNLLTDSTLIAQTLPKPVEWAELLSALSAAPRQSAQ